MASIRKRSWTTGTGEQRTRWQVDYIDQDGKRRHKQFERKKDADGFLVGARYEVVQGTHTPPSARTTVADAVQHWLDHSATEGIDPMTLRTYAAVARHHVTPILGREKLAKLTRPAIEHYRDDLLAGRVPDGRKRSRIMARKALGALKASLKEAQRRGLVAQNVAAGVQVNANRSEAKGRKEVGVDVPSPAEVRAMLKAVTLRWRPLVVTAVFTGLRASELRGLTWADVDFEQRRIRVRRRADRWQQLGKPKSSAGERDVPMAPMVLNTLREWKLACPPTQLDLVFPGPNGNVLDHAALYRRAFGAVQVACGVAVRKLDAQGKPVVDDDGQPVMVPKYGPHAFRHFTASWLIEQGFGPKRIVGIMGHADIQMTFNLYGHLFELNESDHERLAAGELVLVGG